MVIVIRIVLGLFIVWFGFFFVKDYLVVSKNS